MSIENLDTLIKTGNTITTRYEENLKSNTDNSGLNSWYKENILSCQILIEQLQRPCPDGELVLFLAKLIGDYHKNSKPPAILFWCNKIIYFFKQIQ